MSDLQCAATLLLVPADRARDLGQALARTRVARIWTASAQEAQDAAAILAADLRVGVTTSSELDEAGPSGAVLGGIADQHRGETVVVVVNDGHTIVEVAIDGDGGVRRPWRG